MPEHAIVVLYDLHGGARVVFYLDINRQWCDWTSGQLKVRELMSETGNPIPNQGVVKAYTLEEKLLTLI